MGKNSIESLSNDDFKMTSNWSVDQVVVKETNPGTQVYTPQFSVKRLN